MMNIDKTKMNVFKNPTNTLTSNTGIQDSICVRFVVAKGYYYSISSTNN